MAKLSLMPPIRKLAFVVNDRKTGAPELAEELLAIARAAGVEVSRATDHPIPTGFLRGQDACCVIGGDGTLLGIVAEAAREGVPLIGVNRGSLGFLTTFSADEARARLPRLLAGEFTRDSRTLIECTTNEVSALALNEIVIKEASNSRLVRMEVFADDEFVTDYLCDGLIFSTPTGSTAYNLSAGGPLIHPGADVLAMTPICPHTLSNRSIIFRQNVRLRVCNQTRQGRLTIAADGRRLPDPRDDRPIEIALSGRRLDLLQSADYSHFAVVRAKLRWIGGAAEGKA